MQGLIKGFVRAIALTSIGAFAASSWAGVTYDALPTSGTLTSNGWTNFAKNAADASALKNKDYSVSAAGAGTNGVWGMNDNNSPVNAYMYMLRDPGLDGYGLSGSQGLVMARIKAISGTNTSGTFGYTVGFSGNNFSGTLGIRAGAVKFSDADGDAATATNYSTDTTSDYRVYAIRYSAGGAYTAWISNGNNWSANPGDWTQMATGVTTSPMNALTNTDTAAKQSGLLIGSMGSSGNASNTNLDWLHFNKNDIDSDSVLTPWDQGPTLVPEPATLAMLLLGCVPMAMRRRRAA
jgi:hypothetical protein